MLGCVVFKVYIFENFNVILTLKFLSAKNVVLRAGYGVNLKTSCQTRKCVVCKIYILKTLFSTAENVLLRNAACGLSLKFSCQTRKYYDVSFLKYTFLKTLEVLLTLKFPNAKNVLSRADCKLYL